MKENLFNYQEKLIIGAYRSINNKIRIGNSQRNERFFLDFSLIDDEKIFFGDQ